LIRNTCFVFVLSLYLVFLNGQTDLGSWSSVSVAKSINKSTLILKPIARFNNDLASYNNASIDFIVRHKINPNWQVAFLERYWWLDDGVNRNFWFLDLGYRFKPSEKIVLSQYIRWHIAQDIEISDPNFLRWHPSIELNTASKFKPYAGIEFFFRVDGINEFQRTRAKMGGTYVASNKVQLMLRLWREVFFNVDNPRTDYIIEFNVGYKI
jgi:hypothetical protein